MPLLIALVTACGCSDDDETNNDTNESPTGGASAGGGVGGTAGGASGATAAGTGGAGGAGGAGGTAGTTGDANWRSFDWIPQCDGVEYAATPANAVPALTWVPCEGDIPGCTRLDTSWQRDVRGAPPLTPYSFAEVDGKLYLTASVNYRDRVRHEVVYQGDEPVFVARDNSDDCGFSDTRLTASGICATLWPPAGKWVTAWFSWQSPADAPRAMWETVYDRTFACSDARRFASDAAGHASVTDSATGVPVRFTWGDDSDHLTMAAYETHALEIRGAGTNANPIQDGWLWTPERGLESLLPVPGDALLSVLSDGDQLAWVQVPHSPGITTTGDGALWKSPFSLASTALAPVKVADVRAANLGHQKMGGGNYALIENAPNSYQGKLHVYRLSDGRHWELPRLPNYTKPGDPSLVVPIKVLRVTKTDVWWLGAPQVGVTNQTIVRQALAALTQ